MQKTNFVSGSIIEPQFLNALQAPSRFDASLSRVNFYSPTESRPEWELNQRDSIKDWELPNPDVESQTSIGRLAHSGRVLGWYQSSESDPLRIVYGPPRLTLIDFNGISTLSSYHAIVESGSVLDSNLEVINWSRQMVPVGSNLTTFIYYDLEFASLVGAPTLPSRQTKFVPLAKLTIGNSGEIIEYLDLRQSTYVDSLGYYSQRLVNSLYINSDQILQTWARAIVDTSAGSVVLTVPGEDESQDGDELALADISFSFDKNPVVLRASETTSVNNTVEDWVIYNKGISLELYYHAETRSWNFKSPPPNLDEAQPPLGEFMRCGGEVYLGIKPITECPQGEQTPDSEGTFRYNLETSQCYKKYYDTFAIYSDGNSGVFAEKAMRCGATRQEIKNWLNL